LALKLTVISEQAASLGEAASALVGIQGGCIGRSRDNDLVLPDANRYVSAHHARIRYRDGGYLIEDTSTNGVYINGSSEPVGKLGPQPLRSGDVLRLGNYQVRVVDEAAPAVADASAIIPFSPSDSGNMPGDGADLAADLVLENLLVSDPAVSAERRALDPWGQRIEDTGVLRFDRAQSTHTGLQRAPRTAGSSTASKPALRTPPPPPAPRRHGLDPLCRGAGLDTHALPEEGQERMLRLAGMLLREALVGIRELARSQQAQRAELGLREPGEEPERAAMRNLPVEELLARMLTSTPDAPVDPVQWLRELIAQAVRHDAGLLRALRPALEDFTQRLDPSHHGVTGQAVERFRNITEHRSDQLPRLFAEALARGLEEELNGPPPAAGQRRARSD
jgi:type VI secretion system FHA domain protein